LVKARNEHVKLVNYNFTLKNYTKFVTLIAKVKLKRIHRLKLVKCCGKKSCLNLARKQRKTTNSTLATSALPVQNEKSVSKSRSYSETIAEKIFTSGVLQTISSGDQNDADATSSPMDLTTTALTNTDASSELAPPNAPTELTNTDASSELATTNAPTEFTTTDALIKLTTTQVSIASTTMTTVFSTSAAINFTVKADTNFTATLTATTSSLMISTTEAVR